MEKLPFYLLLGLAFLLSCDKGVFYSLPEVETLHSAFTDSSHITLNGNVLDEGKSAVTSRGFCWSLEPNPTVNDSISQNGVGPGNFSEMINYKPNAIYYVKAYAVSSLGTVYGSEITLSSPGKSIIVLVGDSRTDGWNCEYQYPYMDLLQCKESTVIYKTSMGGLSSIDLIDKAEDSVDPKCSDLARMNLLVVWIGANDMAFNDQPAARAFKNVQEYCIQRKSKGWKVIVCTEVSMKGRSIYGESDRVRNRFNDLVKSGWVDFADGIADLAAVASIGSIGAYLDSTYFCDGIHLTNAGTAEVAKIINQAINTLIL